MEATPARRAVTSERPVRSEPVSSTNSTGTRFTRPCSTIFRFDSLNGTRCTLPGASSTCNGTRPLKLRSSRTLLCEIVAIVLISVIGSNAM